MTRQIEISFIQAKNRYKPVQTISALKINTCIGKYVIFYYGELFSEHTKTEEPIKELKEFTGLSKNSAIFNQNCHLTFNGYSITESDIDPFWINNPVIAVMCISENSGQYMRYAFLPIKVFGIYDSINSELFSLQYEEKKQSGL